MADDIQSNIRINVDTTNAMDSIRLLQNQISAFHQQMSKMGAASVADSRNMQQNLINSINSTGQFAANITKIKTTAEQFSYSLEKNKLTMGEYFRYAGGATKTFGKLFAAEFETINKVARERVKDLQSQYIKLGRDANGAMQAIRVRPLTLDMENLGTKTQIAAQRQQLLNQLLRQGSTNLLNFGKNTQWAGRQLMVGFTVPLSIMGGAAMKAYREIEEASLRLKRVYGDFATTAQETDKVVKQVQALALEYTKYGIAVKDSMEVAATAAATGKKGADLLAQISSANRLSALGGIDQQKALQTTISLTDAFSISAKNLGKNINFLNAVENQTVLSIDDLTTAIPKAAPVIQQLGGDVKDLAFFLTAMKEGGINASEGANAIKSGLASIINPTNTASKMLQGFGINLRGIVEANKGDVKKTVVDFAQALDTLDPINRAKAIEQLFGKFQFARMSTLFKNVIEQGSQASEVLKLANQSSLELSMLAQRELGKIEQSPLYKFQKAIADFQAQLAPVGEQFMKAVTPIINFGTDVLKQFNNLGDGVKGFIVQTVAVAGVIGPVLLMSFGLIANAVANVIKGFALVKDIFNKTGKSSMSLGDQVNYMTREQIQAAAIASSLDQVHSKLKQTFTSEAAAVDALTAAYQRSVAAQQAFNVPITPRTPRGPVRKYAAGGIIRGPGTGTSDSILAMVSNGEAIIPAASVARNPAMVRQLVSGNIPGFQDGLVPAYTNAVALLKDQTNQALKTGVSGTSLASEMREIGPGMNSPIVEAIAKSLGAKNNKQIVGMLRDNPDLRSFAESIQIGVAQEMDAIGSKKIQDPELSKIYQTVARKEAAARGQLFAEQTEKFFTTPTTFEDTTTTRQRSSGRIMSVGRASLFKGLPSYRSKNYRPIAEELGTNPIGLVKAHMSDRTFISLKEATTRFGLELSNQAKAAADRMANGIVRASQSIRPRMQQAEAAVAKGMEEEGQMRSPSRVTKQKGAQLVQGAVQGIQEGVDDVRRAGAQLGAATAQGVSQSGRIPGKGGNRVRQEEMAPHSVTGELVPISMINAPIEGAKPGTRAQKMGLTTAGPRGRVSNLLNNFGNKVSSGISGMSQGKFQGGMFGASMIAGLGSMVGGPVGEVSGALSMPLAIAGMFPKVQGAIAAVAGGLIKFIPVIGTALAAWQLWDQVAVPLIKKNADAYKAISDTLNITEDKLVKINNFFGTEAKLTGIRATVAVTGDQTKEQGTIAEQFQQSDQFKETYQESAKKMATLTDKEFTRAMEAYAVDLFGMGYEEDAVKAIVDAIAIEAKKSSVSIAPELFSLSNPESRQLMNKNINEIISESNKQIKDLESQINSGSIGASFNNEDIKKTLSGEYDNFWFRPMFIDSETVEKIKANSAQLGSYISALGAQFQNGTLSAKDFTIQYDKLIAATKAMPGDTGMEMLIASVRTLNPELAKALDLINAISGNSSAVGLVLEASNLGIARNVQAELALSLPGDENAEIRSAVEASYEDAIKKTKANSLLIDAEEKKIKNVQKQSEGLANTEEKINEKYDKRIAQIEKIKKLNEQISNSQKGQLALAEALNSGDIAAAAEAAIDIQKTNVQNALDNQQDGLAAARKAEVAPLKAAQEANTAAVDTLTDKIETLNKKTFEIKLPDILNGKELVRTDSNFGTDFFGQVGFALTRAFDQMFMTNFSGELAPGESSVKIVPKATGGHIIGPGTGTSDDIPAMLSNGEYVIRANAVKTIGVNTLDKLNQADRIGFAAGGMVDKFKKKKPKPPKPKPYTLEDLAKPITRKDDPDWYDYTYNFLEGSGIPFVSPYKWSDAHQGFYRGQSPSSERGVRDILDVEDGKVSFTSVAGAIRYYKALILSRRQAPKYISKILGDNQWTGYGDKQGTAKANSIYSRMFGNYNGLDKAEAKVLANAMTRLWGKDSVKAGFKTLGLSPDLLTNKRMFKDWDVPGQQAWDKYTRNNDEFIPPMLSPNTPKYADGGMVRAYKEGGYIPRESGLSTNEHLPADTANFMRMRGWMVARPGAGINDYGDEIYGHTRNDKTGKYTFNSAMDAYRYYDILIKNRRKLVPFINKEYQKHLKEWRSPEQANNYRISNLVSNKTYGPFDGLTQTEAKTFAKSIKRVYGEESLPKIWKKLGLNPKLLDKPIKLTAEQQRLSSAFAGEVTPTLPDSAPRFSYYANGGMVGCPCGTPGCPGCSKGYSMGGMVGYKDGGPAKPNPAYEAYLEMRKAQKNNGWLESMISYFEGDTAENRAATKWHILRGDRFVTRKIRPGGDTSKVWIDKDGYILNRRDTGRYNPFGSKESRIKNYKDNLISEYDKNGIWQEKRAKFNYNMRVSPFANGGLVGYEDSGLVGSLFGNTQSWLNNLILSMFSSGGNPSAGLDATAADAIKTGVREGKNFTKDYIFDPTNPVDYAMAAIPGGKIVQGIGKGFNAAKGAVKGKIATVNAKKVLGIMGGKEASKLSPQIQVKMRSLGLEKFIGEDVYKTVHQGVKSAAGDSPDIRNLVENAAGINKALRLKPGQSPAYGYLGTKEAVPSYGNSIYGNNSGQGAQQLGIDKFNKMINPYGRGQQLYGSTVLNLKPSALRNATVSFGDSLSIYQQAVKAGVKTPQVMKLGSLLTTLRLSSMARKTKGILGKDFEMPYAEIHMGSGFGLDSVSGIGVSNEFKDRVPEAIASMEAILAQAGRSDIPVYDIIGRGKNAFNKFGENIPKPGKYSMGGMVGKYAKGGFVMPTPEPIPTQFANGGMVRAAGGGIMSNGKIVGGYSMGGMVPEYFAEGGYAMGTDTVPAMLTPGEFVIKKSAVDRIGTAALDRINNGYADGGFVGGGNGGFADGSSGMDSVENISKAEPSNSVYNNTYEINVNVRSESNAEEIARTVLSRIKQVDNQRVRGING